MLSNPTYLKALNPEKNVNRWYSLRMGQDLFGEWLLITQWGRNGFKGQYKEHIYTEEAFAQKEYQRILKKRLNSHKRIGCAYAVIEDKIIP